MNRENKEKRKSVISKLGYIFDKRDKIKIAFLMAAIVVGSFLELAAVVVFMPYIDVLTDNGNIVKKWYLRIFYEGLHFESQKNFMIAFTLVIILDRKSVV